MLLLFGAADHELAAATNAHPPPQLGLVKAALGTVVGFAYPDEPAARQQQFGATAAEIVASGANPPELPVVLIKWDERYYKGPSALATETNVVPVVAKEFTLNFNGRRYKREAFPLLPGTAMTIHNSQGCSTAHHVILPPAGTGGPPGQLGYVQWSRTETLAGVHLLRRVTADDFTRAAGELAAIDAEYARLRALPQWAPTVAAP